MLGLNNIPCRSEAAGSTGESKPCTPRRKIQAAARGAALPGNPHYPDYPGNPSLPSPPGNPDYPDYPKKLAQKHSPSAPKPPVSPFHAQKRETTPHRPKAFRNDIAPSERYMQARPYEKSLVTTNVPEYCGNRSQPM